MGGSCAVELGPVLARAEAGTTVSDTMGYNPATVIVRVDGRPTTVTRGSALRRALPFDAGLVSYR